MYLLIIVLPLFGAIIAGFLGRWLGRYGACIFTISCVLLTCLLSFLAFYEVGFSAVSCHFTLFTWIESGEFIVKWGFLFDSLTVLMLVVITVISTLVHLYSIEYMKEDPHLPRFMSYLEVFTFFMIILVTADNLLQMFVGWEGVGLASYLLINFWHTRLAANQAAIKALVVNRIGDFGLSLGILTLFYIFQSVDYFTIFALTPLFLDYKFIFMGLHINGITLASSFLFMGAVGKSAQLGLHTWLPDAMEGPTPVSALIHAATMVTAGVFLVVRCSPLIEYSPITLFLLTIFGSLTALFGSLTGVFQNDLKKVIAYSTCSQLGYMIFACGLSCYNLSMFHLANHAFFKALLFLSAGSVIHAVSDEQDMRKMGSLINFLPITYSLMLIGSLALSGFPFLTGFYSKDFILELTQLSSYSNLSYSYGSFSCWLGNIAVFFTAFYSFRLLYFTFINNSNLSRATLQYVHESSKFITLPLILLGLGSIFIGYLTKDLFIGFGTDFWGTSVFVLPQHANFIEAEWLSVSVKWLPFFISISGIILATFINIYPRIFFLNFQFNKVILFFAFLLNKKWYWDKIYNSTIINFLMEFGYVISFKTLDRGFIELAGPYGFSKLIRQWSVLIAQFQSGKITHYIFFIVIGLLFLVNCVWPLTTTAFLNSNDLIIICLFTLFFV